jgi:hypothetical protein
MATQFRWQLPVLVAALAALPFVVVVASRRIRRA